MYTISSHASALTGVMLRGRIRKLCLLEEVNIIIDNSGDVPGEVTFAVEHGMDISFIHEYLKSIIDDVAVTLLATSIPNPIVTKAQVNLEDRYEL